VRFRILGPLDLANGAGPHSLDAPKQRALLAVLLLHPNETVSSERLIDELWGERPPATAMKVLQTYVSQLRRIIGAEAIETRPPGYLLRVDEDTLDATAFRRLAGDGRRLAAESRHEDAAARFREALALWRGPPLADVSFESFARNEVERLEEERLSVLMDLIDAELALGRHEHVVPELETLVRQHQLHERLRAQLMLALYRSGRQADALATYQDGRRVLVDELGLEPGRELQELEKAILRHDAALDAPAPPKTPRLAPSPAFVSPWRAGALVAIVGVALAVVLAFALGRGHEATVTFRPNSVGFIDAASGKVTRSFPVGRDPRAIVLSGDSLWVANFRDQTISHVRRATGATATIPVGGHPIDLAADRDTIWVLTLENVVVPVDPRYDEARTSSAIPVGQVAQPGYRGAGRIAAGAGFLWITVPGSTVIRIDPANPGRRLPIVPDSGARGPIEFYGGEAWVAGAGDVFALAAESGAPGAAIGTGAARGLAFGDGSVWVVSGGPGHIGAVKQALRRVNPESRLVEITIPVGANPVAVVFAAGSVWVAGRTDRTVYRVDPAQNRVVDALRLGTGPIDFAPDEHGVWLIAAG
jgi:DNA-binding SARP family transcriptional activator/DNA-binding beta-propeller fold protein YncE